jgi:hypothetical protein
MAGKRHSKRSIAWDKDPDILARLAVVADMMSQGRRLNQVAAALNVSQHTADRDAARVRELWRRAAMQSIEDKRAQSKAKYEALQAAAWAEYRKAQQKGQSGLAQLRLIAEIEEKINRLDGTIITRVDMTTKGESIADPRKLTDSELETLAGLSPETPQLG